MLPCVRYSKWMFFSNIQKEVWDILHEVLTLEYTRELKFQVVQNENAEPIPVADSAIIEDNNLQVFFLQI